MRSLRVAASVLLALTGIAAIAPVVEAATSYALTVSAPKPGQLTRVQSSVRVTWVVSGSTQSGSAAIRVMRAPVTSSASCPALTSSAWIAVGRLQTTASTFLANNLTSGMCYRWLISVHNTAGVARSAWSGIVIVTNAKVAPTPTPRPTVAPTPTPRPTVAPTPTPTPVAAQLPIAEESSALLRTNVDVPLSIDSSGATDVTAKLSDWIRTIPDRSTILLSPGGRYRVDGTLRLLGRTLTLDGRGAMLVSVTREIGRSMLEPVEGSLTVRNLVLDGGAPVPGLRYPAWGQHSFEIGIASRGARLTVDHVTIQNFMGDGIYLGANFTAGGFGTNGTFSHDVWIHDSTITGVGRDAVSVTQARRVLGERLVFANVALHGWNNEPNLVSDWAIAPPNDERIADITFRDSDLFAPIGDYEFASAGWGTASRITVDGIRVHGKQLRMIVMADPTHRRNDVRITNCWSDTTIVGAIIRFSHVDRLYVAGNSPASASSGAISVSDSTGVTLR